MIYTTSLLYHNLKKNLASFIILHPYVKIIQNGKFGGTIVELSTILMIVGIICIIVSFFLKDTSKKIERELEDLSINFYQETNAIKRRLKAVEEELLLEPTFKVKPSQNVPTSQKSTQIQNKPINQILVQQVIALNKQGYPIDEISKMSTLSKEQILHILNSGGQS